MLRQLPDTFHQEFMGILLVVDACARFTGSRAQSPLSSL